MRPLDPADAEQIHEIYRDPAVWEHIDGASASRSLAETRARIDRFITCQHEHGFSFWAVQRKQSGELIGDCGLIPRDWRGPEVELGYRLAPSSWGQGFATEAAAAWITVAFEHLELDRIIAVSRAEHLASRRVMEKITEPLPTRLNAAGHVSPRQLAGHAADAVIYQFFKTHHQ